MCIFSLEEMNILEIYSGKTKEILIQNMEFALPYMNKQLQKMIHRIIKKLSLLSEGDYQNIVLFTAIA